MIVLGCIVGLIVIYIILNKWDKGADDRSVGCDRYTKIGHIYIPTFRRGWATLDFTYCLWVLFDIAMIIFIVWITVKHLLAIY